MAKAKLSQDEKEAMILREECKNCNRHLNHNGTCKGRTTKQLKINPCIIKMEIPKRSWEK